MNERNDDDSDELFMNYYCTIISIGSGEIEFEEFAALIARFVLQEEDTSGLEEELREAFRLYDKGVYCNGS